MLAGTLEVTGTQVGEAHLALFGAEGNGIYFRTPRRARRAPARRRPADRRPLARYGTFAMNTQAELQRAMDDYREGRMGRIANPTYDRIRL